jgi:hypothetical protein
LRTEKRGGSIDITFALKTSMRYKYIHGNRFLRQDEDDKVFIFKMSTCGPRSRVDLVTRMQKGGDLEDY